VRLPPKTTSFRGWAERLNEYGGGAEFEAETRYWLSAQWEQLSTDLPVDEILGMNTAGSARSVTVWLSEEETRVLLQAVPAAYHTRIDELLLTALVQAYSKWTGNYSLLIRLEGHGREDVFEDVNLSRTVGWFTTSFPVILHLDSRLPGQALQQVKEQLRAVPNRGLSYGVMQYISGDNGRATLLRGLPRPQVGFNYLGQFHQLFRESSLFIPAAEAVGPSQAPESLRQYLLEVIGIIVNGRLKVDWIYSGNIHRLVTVEALVGYFGESLRELINHCRSAEASSYIPSDFPDVNLTQDELDKVVSQLSFPED
jgi:non-ribosomal peptide synthase protein (TIGR01720 family)